VPSAPPSADLAYAYDSGNQRVIKTATDAAGNQRHTVFVSGALELRQAEWIPDPSDPATEDYADSTSTEVPYLVAHGVRLARLAYDSADPSIGGATVHVLLELGDHLGSTTTVIDKATGELVERVTYQAYGATESDYRPQRWDAFREDYRFTGKEEDTELGLTYFGQRYYAPLLGRWMSPDPLAVHGLEADMNLYAYVHGNVSSAVDALGMDDTPKLPTICIEATKSDAGWKTDLVSCSAPQPNPKVPTIGPYEGSGDYAIVEDSHGRSRSVSISELQFAMASDPELTNFDDKKVTIHSNVESKKVTTDGTAIAIQVALERAGVLPKRITGPHGETLGPVEPDPEAKGFRVQPEPKAPDEVFYRAMEPKAAELFRRTGQMPASKKGETFISPTLTYIQKTGYDGEIFEIMVKAGTVEQLEKIGLRNEGRNVRAAYPDMAPVKGVRWMRTHAQFKEEGDQINIGLGRDGGRAMQIFNQNITSVRSVPRPVPRR
jgi:RHS repeat-associated protein